MMTRLAPLCLWAFVTGATLAQTETPELVIPDGHVAPLTRVLLSPDERFVFTLSADETVRMWDFATGAAVRSFAKASHSIALTPNGKFLVTGAPYIFLQDSLIRVWRIDNGMAVRSVRGHDVIGIDAQGKMMLTSYRQNGRMTVYRTGVLVGEEEFLFQSDSATAWAVNSDLSRVALGFADGRIEFHDLRNGTVKTWAAHAEEIVQLQFTRDGRYLVTGGGDRLIHLFDLLDFRLVRSIWANFNRAFCMDPGATTLWSASFNNTVDQFDLTTGTYTGLIDHNAYSIAALALSQDGELLVEACTDKKIRVIHLPTRRLLREIGSSTLFVSHLSIDQRGEYLVASGFDHRIRLWSLATGEKVRTIPSRDVMQTVVADSLGWMISTVAGPSLDIKTWPSGEFVRMRGYHEFLCYALALSPSQRWMATGGYDRRILVYRTAGGDPVLSLSGHRGNIMALAFSADERVLLSSSFDETLSAWSVEGGHRLWTIQAGLINQLIVAPGDRVLGAGQDGWIYEWNIHDGVLLRKLHAQTAAVTSIALDPKGDRLASASEDGNVRLWEYSTWESKGCMTGHRGAVNSIVITPDGKRLASAGHDGSVRLWDMQSTNLLAVMVGLQNDEWITILADGRYFGSPDADESLFYRFGNQTFSVRQFASVLKTTPGLDLHKDAGFREQWNRPPIVEIVRPYAPPQIQDGQFRFDVRAPNRDSVSLHLYLNNELVQNRRVQAQLTISCEVKLHHGYNQIRVVGIDDRGLKSLESKMYVYYE